MRINYLKLKTGAVVELKHKISLFVGPNNSGKSQTLKDIRCLLDRRNSPFKTPVILKDDLSCFDIPSSIQEIFNDVSHKDSLNNVDHYTIEGINSSLTAKNNFEVYKPQLDSYDINVDNRRHLFFQWFSNWYIALMDAETRLRLSSETPSFTPSETSPENLLQSLFLQTDIEKILRKAFIDAFSQDIKLDISQLTKLCIRVGNNVNTIPFDARVAHTIAKEIPKIDDQGDGYRSFAGIVIGLLICKGRIILLDEPEAFLHPAQAFFLGKWIGEHQDILGSQLLICSHSSNFLCGILTGTKELELFRLSRDGNETQYTPLTSDVANQLISNPILSSQRVIEGIFHKGVVICEADADRAVYQSVATICHNSNREILFIHAHNKQTLAIVASVLKMTGTPVACISDIDILRPEKDLDDVYSVLAEHPLETKLKNMQKELDDYIDNREENDILKELKDNVDELERQLTNGEHSLEGAKSALSRILKETNKWSLIKREGVNSLEKAQKANAEQLINQLALKGLFVVPVGELEGWINLGVRKNKWIIPALTLIYERKTPEPLINFVGDILAYFK